MINLKMENGIFNFRVAGLLFNNGRVLIHRGIKDEFYAFPGGRLEMLETTENTIIREMQEELGIDISVERLLWVCESFFSINNNKYHEVCYYYLIECKNEEFLGKGDKFYINEDGKEFEFKWVTIEEAKNEALYPIFIKDRLGSLPKEIERVVESEN